MSRVLVLLFLSCPVLSQELITNGDFEDYLKCPTVFVSDANYQVFVGWKSLDQGTPDYYNTCGEGDVKVPRVWAGKQYPYNGNGFAGIYVWSKSGYREYLTANLSGEVFAGLVYEIRISYALAQNSPFTCDWLGVQLLDGKGVVIQTIEDFEVENTDPQSGWVTALIYYTATGRENSLTIGNFHANEELVVVDVRRTYVHPMLVDKAYFFIDGVSFLEPQGKDTPTEVFAILPTTLDDVHFDFDRSSLTPASFVQLDSLAGIIKDNSENQFIITGHTDNIGSRDYNMRLSEERALSVLTYLVMKGVAGDWLTAVGKGNTEPVAANTTALGRGMNRRVTVTQISAR
jgi:OmpA-OmpF porin, OOP family